MSKKYQVVGIGNAIVDVLTQSDDTFLEHLGIQKGIMQLIERERAETLYGAMEGRVQGYLLKIRKLLQIMWISESLT